MAGLCGGFFRGGELGFLGLKGLFLLLFLAMG